MALSIEQKRELLARNLPRTAEVRRRLVDYMSRTELRPEDLRARTGYSGVSIRQFLNGKYENVASTSRAICDALVTFMDTHPILPPTQHEGGRLYETQDVKMVRQHFYDALEYGRAYYLRGAPGTQKSFASEYLIAELNLKEVSKNGHGARAFYVYCSELMRPNDLLKEMAIASGTLTIGTNRRIVRNLRFDLRGRKALFVFDEAQHLDVHCLEVVRELHDRDPHCGMLFLGSHELEKIFQRLDMEQWRSRIHHGADLPGVSREEAVNIIHAEIGKEAAEEKIEFPKGSGRKVAREKVLLDSSMATDVHKGRAITYLNARTLFRSLNGFQTRVKAKGATA